MYIINRLPTPVLTYKSPFAKLYNKESDYRVLRVFGCKCYPLLRPYGLSKLEYRSKPCIFLGYSHAGYKCLDLDSNKVYLSCHVVFDENSFPAMEKAVVNMPSKITAQSDAPFVITVSLSSPSSSLVSHDITMSPLAPPSLSSPTNPSPSSSQCPTSSASLPNILPSHSNLVDLAIPTPSLPSALPVNIPSSNPSHHMTTRSQTDSLKPKTFPDYKLFTSTKHPFHLFHTILHETKPSCSSKAASNAQWRGAMKLEFDALISNGTWTLCPRPNNHNVIRNKWVYKIKQKLDGSVDRFKARLVAKGFKQQCGIDYTETFSPVIKPSIIRIILTLAVNYNWPIKQLDVSNAFLHGSLIEQVFMEQPKGFVDTRYPNYVCQLHKAIYGLKQASRAWYNRLSSCLLDLGFITSLMDNSLFIYHYGDIKIFMLIYVDDTIVTGTHLEFINSLISRLQLEFPLKHLGPPSFFLGIQATRTEHG